MIAHAKAWALLLGKLGLRRPSETMVCVPRQFIFMPYRRQHPFLTLDIQLLPLPIRVKKLMTAAGFSTLKEFLKLPHHQWESHVPGLTARYRKEIVFFLFKIELNSYLKVE